MKAHLRVPTEQYAYIEVTVEHKEDSIDRVIESYFSVKDAYEQKVIERQGGEGMDEKEMDTWVYNMLLGKGNDADVYQKATPAQQKELHRIKRALAKIKRNQGVEEELNYGDDDRKDQADRD